MPFPTIIEQDGSRSATVMAKEAVFGTAVAGTTTLPMLSNTLEYDPGWFSPELMMAARDLHVFNMYGEAKLQGTVEGPLFPSNAMALTAASVGQDAQTGWGVAAATPTTASSTTVNGALTAGTSTVVVASGTGFAVGQQIAVDSGYLQEIRKISNVVTTTITLSDPLNYSHATGVAAVTGAPTTTLNGSVTAGATTVIVTSAAGLANTNIIQIDVNTPAGSITSEIRKITNIATNTLTLDQAIGFNHATGANVILVGAGPYTHTFSQTNFLPSLTIEKNAGSFQSLQFAGCRVGKYSVKAPVGNEPIKIAADVSGQSVLVLSSPTAVSVTNEIPFVFTEATLNIFGGPRYEVSNVELDVNNGLKETWTYGGNNGPGFITPVTITASGKIDLVWSSFNDATYGDFTKMKNGTLGAMLLGFAHPSNGGSVTYFMPQVALSKYANDLKMTDIVMAGLTYEATRPLSGTTQYTIAATVVNAVYLPY
jgi:hypothetical protein